MNGTIDVARDDLLRKSLESNVVTVEVGEEGVVRVRSIVLHTAMTILGVKSKFATISD
jgi:hypothetical protein